MFKRTFGSEYAIYDLDVKPATVLTKEDHPSLTVSGLQETIERLMPVLRLYILNIEHPLILQLRLRMKILVTQELDLASLGCIFSETITVSQ